MPSRSQIYQSMERTPSPPSRTNTDASTTSAEASPYASVEQTSTSGSPTSEQNFFGALAARVRREPRSRFGAESDIDSDPAFRSRSRSPRRQQTPPTAAAPPTQARPAQQATTEADVRVAANVASSRASTTSAERQYSLSSGASTLVEPLPRPSMRTQQAPPARRLTSGSSRHTSSMFYGRHTNSWLFNDFSVRAHVKELLPKRKRRDS